MRSRANISLVRRALCVLAVAWFAPLALFAQTGQPVKFFQPQKGSLTFTGVANKFGEIVNVVIPFLIGIAFVAILFGIFTYLRSAGDAEKLAEGRRVAIWGVIALFLMLSFWGFVIMIKTSLFG
ncbi:MAG: hypothetical protein AAB699_00510 [Patescibacteria group bacterium]